MTLDLYEVLRHIEFLCAMGENAADLTNGDVQPENLKAMFQAISATSETARRIVK